LHQLPEEERSLLGRAAVLGRIFYPRGLHSFSPDEADHVDALLHSLQLRRLVHDSSTDLVDEPAMSFDHALIQEAAYRQLPKSSRIELHGLAADWLTGISQHPSTFQAIAHHRKMAVERAMELDYDGAQLVPLKEKAARAAFDAAHSLDATSSGAVIDYLRSCVDLTDDLELKCKASFDLMLLNDPKTTHDGVDPLIERAQGAERLDLAHLLQGAIYYHVTGSEHLPWADFRSEATSALAFATERGDTQLVLRALISIAQSEQQLAPAAAVDAARSAWSLIQDNDNLLTSSIANLVLGTAGNLNASFDQVQAIVNEVLAVTSSFRVEHRGISVLARFAANADLTTELQILLDRHVEMAPRIRPFDLATNIAFMLAPALALVERHDEACAMWDSVSDYFEDVFGHDVMASVWPEIALSLIALDRVEEARRLLVEANRTTSVDDDLGMAQWYAANARLAAIDADVETAHRYAEEAVRWVDVMALGAGFPQRLRIEAARALAQIGESERARVLALTSREQALTLSALGIVRRANDVLTSESR
jgi:hypothetical protein